MGAFAARPSLATTLPLSLHLGQHSECPESWTSIHAVPEAQGNPSSQKLQEPRVLRDGTRDPKFSVPGLSGLVLQAQGQS